MNTYRKSIAGICSLTWFLFVSLTSFVVAFMFVVEPLGRICESKPESFSRAVLEVAMMLSLTALPYLSSVLLGAGPAVILESCLTNPTEKGVVISLDTWHGPKYLIFDAGSTLCDHCWILPVRVACSIFACIALSCYAAILSVYVCIGLLLGYERDESVTIKLAAFSPRITGPLFLEKKRTESKLEQKPPGLFRLFFRRLWETIGMLRQRACPTIRWSYGSK